MTAALLDINVLIALVDPDHADHLRVHAWAADGLSHGWASCAITENGFVRILSQPAYPAEVTVNQAVALLRDSAANVRHKFWPCDISVLDSDVVASEALLGHRQITDAYLLALAVHHGGRLVTLDRSVPLATVPGATDRHLLVL